MPIDNVAPRFRELGRLKFGEDLGDRPTQLSTWRITSNDPHLIEAAAQAFGGVAVYRGDGDASEVVTEKAELECLIPAQDLAAGQWLEHWTAGGLQRRCSGTSLVEFDDAEPDGWRKVAPCLCDEENGPRLCKPTTVLRVLLPQLPDLGVWKLTTRSLYAAQELPVAVSYLFASPDRLTAPAVLGLDHRTSKKPGQKPKHYTVPVLRSGPALASIEGQAPLPDSLPAERQEPGPQISPPPPAEAPALEAPPVSGTTTAAKPEPAHTGHPRRSEGQAALAVFLEDVDPGNLPHDADELRAILYRLEELAIAADVWKAGALEAAAGRWVDAQIDWKTTPHPHYLATFTQRAVLAVLGRKETPHD